MKNDTVTVIMSIFQLKHVWTHGTDRSKAVLFLWISFFC